MKNYVSHQAREQIKNFLKNKEYNIENLTQILKQLNQGTFTYRQGDKIALNKEIRRQVENKVSF